MKKLLFSLGTVTAIVAPVAAVVACGSKSDSTPTFKTSGEFNKYIVANGNGKKLGGVADQVFNKVKDKNGNVVISSLQKDTEKNSKSIAVFVKGTPEALPSGKDWDKAEYFKWAADAKNTDVANDDSSEKRWSVHEKDLANISYVVFLYNEAGVEKVEVAKVFKGTNNTFGIQEVTTNRFTIQ